jgi:hypothetical protein
MKLYSLPQLVELLGVSYTRIRRAAKNGVVRPLQAGHSRSFTEADLKALENHFGPTSD